MKYINAICKRNLYFRMEILTSTIFYGHLKAISCAYKSFFITEATYAGTESWGNVFIQWTRSMPQTF